MELSKLMGSPASISKATSAGPGVGTVTVTGKAALCIFIHGITISASAAPATAVQVTLKDGTTTILPLEIPAAAFAPIVIAFGNNPIQISQGSDAVLTIPSLGGTAVSSGTLRYSFGSP